MIPVYKQHKQISQQPKLNAELVSFWRNFFKKVFLVCSAFYFKPLKLVVYFLKHYNCVPATDSVRQEGTIFFLVLEDKKK